MAAPNAIRGAAMIPSRTTFHDAVGEATHVMQRRIVAVLAARQLSLGRGVSVRGPRPPRYWEIQRGRYARLAELGPLLERSGRLRPDYYIQYVFEQGWSPDRFEAWLGDALVDLVLVPS